MHYAVVGFKIDYSPGSICKKKKKSVHGLLNGFTYHEMLQLYRRLLISVLLNCCMKCDQVFFTTIAYFKRVQL